MTAATAFEEERLRQSMLDLNCFDPEQVTAPADAEIVRQEGRFLSGDAGDYGKYAAGGEGFLNC